MDAFLVDTSNLITFILLLLVPLIVLLLLAPTSLAFVPRHLASREGKVKFPL
jgi:hypothetical protein